MPIHVETTARIAVVYKYSRDAEGRADGVVENYRGPIEILVDAGGRFETVRPPLGGGGHARLSMLEAAGYRVEVIELAPVPEAGRTPDPDRSLADDEPRFPKRNDRAPMYGGSDEDGL